MWLAFLLLISIAPGFYFAWRTAGIIAWKVAINEYKDDLKKYGRPVGPLRYELIDEIPFPTNSAWVDGIFVGIGSFLIWPILVLILVFSKIGRSLNKSISPNTMGYIPKDKRELIQSKRIEQLEREVGIR